MPTHIPKGRIDVCENPLCSYHRCFLAVKGFATLCDLGELNVISPTHQPVKLEGPSRNTWRVWWRCHASHAQRTAIHPSHPICQRRRPRKSGRSSAYDYAASRLALKEVPISADTRYNCPIHASQEKYWDRLRKHEGTTERSCPLRHCGSASSVHDLSAFECLF